jgi:hypothetical protein
MWRGWILLALLDLPRTGRGAEGDAPLGFNGEPINTDLPAEGRECDRDADCEEREDGRTICDKFNRENGQCDFMPDIPSPGEFGYFSQVVNRTFVSNYTKTNVSYVRVYEDTRDCTVDELATASCHDAALCRVAPDDPVPVCMCKANHFGDGVESCERCPTGAGWTSASPVGARWKTDCRTDWESHWDTITLSNEVITVKLDQNGMRSSIFNDISPKWDPVSGQADAGSGPVDRRALHECRDSAVAANNMDDLSSHCRHLIGQATGHGAEEGSGRVFRYTADEFQLKVHFEGELGDYVLASSGMALDDFKLSGVGKDCGRAHCGGTTAVYRYKQTQELGMPHHKLRNTNAFRSDVKGPRGFVRPANRPYSTSPARPRGSGGAPPRSLHGASEQEVQASLKELEVTVTYKLEPGDEFVRKEVAVQAVSGEVIAVTDSKPWHVLEGCQVLRPNDDCPSRSGTGGRGNQS